MIWELELVPNKHEKPMIEKKRCVGSSPQKMKATLIGPKEKTMWVSFSSRETV